MSTPGLRRMVACKGCQYVGTWEKLVDGDFPAVEAGTAVDLEALRFSFQCPRCGAAEGPLGVDAEPENFQVTAVVTGGQPAEQFAEQLRALQGADAMYAEVFGQLMGSERFREFLHLNFEVTHHISEEEKRVVIHVHEKPVSTPLTMGEITDIVEAGGGVCMACGAAVEGQATCSCGAENVWTLATSRPAAEERRLHVVKTGPDGMPLGEEGRKLIEAPGVQKPGELPPQVKARVESIVRGKGDPDKPRE